MSLPYQWDTLWGVWLPDEVLITRQYWIKEFTVIFNSTPSKISPLPFLEIRCCTGSWISSLFHAIAYSAMYWCVTWDCARAVLCVFVSLCVHLPSIVLEAHYKFLESSCSWTSEDTGSLCGPCHTSTSAVSALVLCLVCCSCSYSHTQRECYCRLIDLRDW